MGSDDASAASRWGVLGRLVDEKTVALFSETGFRWLYLGRAVGRVGDKLYFIAAMWLVYELTGSTFYTGVAGFLFRLPQAIGFVFGPIVDRSRLRRLMIVVEGAQGIIVLAVPVTFYLWGPNVLVVMAVVPILALLRRLSAPAEQAALPRLVPDELLARANSVDSATERSLGALAQGFGGALIAVSGAVALYLINSVTFFVTAMLYAMLQISPTEATGSSHSWREYMSDVREGLDLIRLSAVGHMAVAASIAGVFTSMATAVLPAFADTFGGVQTYGFLVASVTLGMLLGSIAASRFEEVPLGGITIVGLAFGGISRFGSVVVDAPVAILVLYGSAAVPLGVYNVLTSTTIQVGVPNELLARVSSTIGSLTAVLGPLGFLVGGYVGETFGSGTAIALSAVGYALVAIYWLLIPALREFPAVNNLESGCFDTQENA